MGRRKAENYARLYMNLQSDHKKIRPRLTLAKRSVSIHDCLRQSQAVRRVIPIKTNWIRSLKTR
jgi:hypothetical protein